MKKSEGSELATHAPSRRNRGAMELKRVRFLPMFELILPSAAILALLWLGDAECPPWMYDYLKKEQSNVQVAVQIIAHALALLQVVSLCTTFNLSTRLRFLKRPTCLQDLSLWIAISTARVDVNLPKPHLAVASIFVLATLLPGALWAGALSPLFVQKTMELGEIALPAFTVGVESKAQWDAEFQVRNGHQIANLVKECTVVNDARGLVSNCPVPTLQGPLLLSASSASTMADEPRNHSKLDSPTWQFIGRSYGVGSSAGHASDDINDNRVLSYVYSETGYMANVMCMRNSTSDFRLRYVRSLISDVTPAEYQRTHHPELDFDHSEVIIKARLSTYLADGYLPNSVLGVPEYYPVISWRDDYQGLVTWAAVANAGRNMIAIAAGKDHYKELDQIQCEVFYTPTIFNVTIDRSQQSISVVPQDSAEAHDIDPTHRLQAHAIHSLYLLARMSPSLYVSVLGESLSRNIERMQKQRPHLPRAEVVTLAVAESFTAIIDDILVAYGASQIVNAQDTTLTAAHGIVEAAQIGQPFYHNLVWTLNSLIIMIVAFEATRTRCWRSLTRFNYLDSKSVIIAASAGGGGVAKAVLNEHNERGTDWIADPGDAVACGLKIRWLSRSMPDGTETFAIAKA